MRSNRTFFKRTLSENITLHDIFSEVFQKHSGEEVARVFTAGTSLTTPPESQMLINWNKPFLFFRFFLIVLLAVIACDLTIRYVQHSYILMAPIMILVAILMPISLLLLIWEMNIPRNISLYEVMGFMLLGGLLSLILTPVLSNMLSEKYMSMAIFAPITEEPTKLLVIYLILKKKNYRYCLNGMLVGASVGAGFAVFETLGYVILKGMGQSGVEGAITIALNRAITSIPGHGGYALLYGAALVIAQRGEPLSAKHLGTSTFLKYFAISAGLHALHNSSFPGLIPFPFGYLALTGIWCCVFLPLLTQGVRQIVQLSAAQNHGEFLCGTPWNAERQQRTSAMLVGSSPNIRGKCYTIPKDRELILGRNPQYVNVVISGVPTVSGCHCKLFLNAETVYIVDLNSSNGTYVNGRRITPNQPTPLANGESVALGQAGCVFYLSR